jgi:hypothetical protein
MLHVFLYNSVKIVARKPTTPVNRVRSEYRPAHTRVLDAGSYGDPPILCGQYLRYDSRHANRQWKRSDGGNLQVKDAVPRKI